MGARTKSLPIEAVGENEGISPLVYAKSPHLRSHLVTCETQRSQVLKIHGFRHWEEAHADRCEFRYSMPLVFCWQKNLDKAMEQSKDKFDFEVRWHPFFLNPDAPKEGIRKSDFYKTKFGPVQFERATSRMTEIFRGLGLEYDMSGLTGNTMDSHRLITLAGHQGYDKQNALVEELFQNYFCQGKYIGDKQVLLDAARKTGIEGAEELLEDPSKGVDEVQEELNKYSSGISGVPHFVINGKYQLSGGQPPHIFMRAFEMAAKDGA